MTECRGHIVRHLTTVALLAGGLVLLLPDAASAICGRKSCVVRDIPVAPDNSYTAPVTRRTYSSNPTPARGPNDPGWYCRARAPSGKWGWGNFDSQSESQARALRECGLASGQTCTIQYCRQQGAGGTVLQTAATPPPAVRSAATQQTAAELTPGQYYCRAVAPGGASGWGTNSDQSSAATRALNECYNYSRGRKCTLQYCNLGGPRTASGRQGGETRTASATMPTHLRDAPADVPPPAKRDKVTGPKCEVCDRHLFGDLCGKALAVTANAIVNVAQARTDFLRCRQRVQVECGDTPGLIYIKTSATGCLAVAKSIDNDAVFFRACIKTSLAGHCR